MSKREWTVTDEADPQYLPVPHDVTDPDKLRALVDSMREHGWIGRPILVVDGDAWTGSHRIAAAAQAGLEAVPVYEVVLSPYDSGNPGIVEMANEFGYVQDQNDMAQFLAKYGDAESQKLLAREMEAK